MCRRSKAGVRTVSFGKKVPKFIETHDPPPDLQQSPCHIADHVMQKTISLHGQEQTMT